MAAQWSGVDSAENRLQSSGISDGARAKPGWRGLCAVAAFAGLALAACGGTGAPQSAPSSAAQPQPATPVPTASQPAASASPPAPSRGAALISPPFGEGARVQMTSYLPGDKREDAAVAAPKDFLIAVLYSDYTGGRDRRWARYVTSPIPMKGMEQTLSQPGVTTESFRGTVRVWHMTVSGTPDPKGTVVVTECVDSSHAQNTSLKTGKVLPSRLQSSKDQNFYSNSDVLAERGGRWLVISIPPVITYPRAVQCKP